MIDLTRAILAARHGARVTAHAFVQVLDTAKEDDRLTPGVAGDVWAAAIAGMQHAIRHRVPYATPEQLVTIDTEAVAAFVSELARLIEGRRTPHGHA